MDEVMTMIEMYLPFIVIGLAVMCVILLIVSIVAIVKANKLKKRIDKFLRPQSENHNIEAMLIDYLDKVQWMSDQHDKIVAHIKNINGRLTNCIQKVGLVRYNPFDEVGGDLCFALALLDEKNSGTVINSIYSREGCYTYCKPIVNGTCEEYKLSKEEEDAVGKAMENK